MEKKWVYAFNEVEALRRETTVALELLLACGERRNIQPKIWDGVRALLGGRRQPGGYDFLN